MNDLRGKTCFVTGGSGYVGRNIIRTLLAHKCTVQALARSEPAGRLVEGLGATAIAGDLNNTDALSQGMDSAHLLIHAAADTRHAGQSSTQDSANIAGTQNLYQIARNANLEKVIHISTEAVLLTGEPLVNANEQTPLPTSWPGDYSRTKAEAEKVALKAADDGLPLVVLRPRFVWGGDDTTALPQLIEAARSGKLVWIDGGHYLTSATHVDNLCHAIMLALTNGQNGETYFITDGEPVGFRTFITQMLASQNVTAPTKTAPRFIVKWLAKASDTLARLTGGKLKGPLSFQEYATVGVEVTLDISKARNELGYAPVISRQSGLESLAQGS